MIKLLIKDTFVYGVLNTINKFILILLIPVYARCFGTDGFGYYDILLTTINLLMLIFGLQIESGLARHYYEAKKYGETRDMVSTAFMVTLFSSLLGLIVTTGLVLSLQSFLKGIPINLLLIALLVVPFYIIHNILLVIFRFEEKQAVYALLAIGDIFVTGVLSLTLIFIFHRGVESVFYSLMFSKLIFSIVGLFMARELLSFTFSLEWAKKELYYCVPMVPAVASNWGLNYVNRFIMLSILTLSDVGLFGLAARIGGLVMIPDQAFRLAWDPMAVKLMDDENCGQFYVRVFRLYTFVMIFICAMITLFSPEIVRIFGGNAYLAAIPSVGLIAFGFFWRGVNQILGLGVAKVKKTYLNTTGFVVGVIINIAILYLTIHKWYILGVAFAFLTGSMSSTLIIFYLAQRQYHITYNYVLLFSFALLSFVYPLLINVVNSQLGQFELLTLIMFKTIITVFVFSALWYILLDHSERDKIVGFLRDFLTSKIIINVKE